MPHIATIYGIAKLAERGGIYWIAISKTINNQLQGYNLLRKYMAWDRGNHQGMEEHVRSPTLNSCNKNGVMAGVARGP